MNIRYSFFNTIYENFLKNRIPRLSDYEIERWGFSELKKGHLDRALEIIQGCVDKDIISNLNTVLIKVALTCRNSNMDEVTLTNHLENWVWSILMKGKFDTVLELIHGCLKQKVISNLSTNLCRFAIQAYHKLGGRENYREALGLSIKVVQNISDNQYVDFYTKLYFKTLLIKSCFLVKEAEGNNNVQCVNENFIETCITEIKNALGQPEYNSSENSYHTEILNILNEIKTVNNEVNNLTNLLNKMM